MELPEDIIGYLVKFIKPKRYTLLNKFCRDHYFRKYGVSVELQPEYINTDLYNKYGGKIILRLSIHPTYLETIVSRIQPNTKVTYIKCTSYVGDVRYKILRKAFPNLRKLKCSLTYYDAYKITQTALEGTLITSSIDSDMRELERLANLGYELHIPYDPMYFCSEAIRNNVVITYVRENYPIIDLDKFPNLRCLYLPSKITDYIVENIKKHPTIRKIQLNSNIIPPYIVKNNGHLVDIVGSMWSNTNNNPIKDQTMYEMVKKYYNTIFTRSDLDVLAEYELRSKISKRMNLVIPLKYIDNDKIKKLLNLFNVEIRILQSELNIWLRCAKKYKVKAIDYKVVYKLYIGDGKLYVVLAENNDI